jgi:hypothetical protein
MKQKILLIGALSFVFATNAWAERQEGCAAAVDAADSMNVNQNDDCDYSDEGLNGYLHNAFNKNKKQTVAAKEQESKAIESSAHVATGSIAKAEIGRHQFKQDVDQWAGINLARSQMLPKVLSVCTQGFRLISEEYRPLPMGRIELKLVAECIEQ